MGKRKLSEIAHIVENPIEKELRLLNQPNETELPKKGGLAKFLAARSNGTTPIGKQIDRITQRKRFFEKIKILLNERSTPDTHVPEKVHIGLYLSDRLYPKEDAMIQTIKQLDPITAKKEAKMRGLSRAIEYQNATNNEIPLHRKQLDICSRCGGMRVINWHLSQSVCPRDFDTVYFPSHVFDDEETHRDDGKKDLNTSHSSKFMKQCSVHFPAIPIDILEQISTELLRFHFYDRHQPKKSNLMDIAKNIPRLSSIHRNSKIRLERDLRCQPSGIFSTSEINRLLLHRQHTIGTESIYNEVRRKHQKSSNNTAFLRNAGRTFGYGAARLFPPPRTINVQLTQTRAMEKDVLMRQSVGIDSDASMDPYPAS